MSFLYAYALKMGGTNLDHTYATSSDGNVWPCWGRSSGGEMIVGGHIGNSKQADFMSSPKSHAGLVYALNGVCHQTANRILYFTNETVHKAAGYWASTAMYGTYGGSCNSIIKLVTFIEWKKRIKKGKNISSDSIKANSASENEDKSMMEYLAKVKGLYELDMDETKFAKFADENDFLAQELDFMADFKLGADKSEKDVEFLKDCQTSMLAEKDKLDMNLINNNITVEDYTNKVNKLMSDFLRESSSQLGKETHMKLFNITADDDIQIVDPSMISVDEIREYYKNNSVTQ